MKSPSLQDTLLATVELIYKIKFFYLILVNLNFPPVIIIKTFTYQMLTVCQALVKAFYVQQSILILVTTT